MNWLTSPLAATVVVCTALAALSIPLRRLTSDRVLLAIPAAQTPATREDHGHALPGVLRVRLLAPVESLMVSTTSGEVLWNTGRLEPGEHQAASRFSLIDDALELLVEAVFDDGAGDTALFLTVLPDGVEEQTHYTIGSGGIEEILFFEWELH